MVRVALVAFALVCATLVPHAVLAQAAPSQIEVRVVDAAGKAIGDARVSVVGPDTASVLTPRDGVIRFNDVTPGLYEVKVDRAGYDGVHIGDVEALVGRRRVVDVTLVRSQPPSAARSAPAGGFKEIGHVRARSAAKVASVDVDEDNPLRRISENLSDALGKLAGVSVDQPSATGTLTISIHNTDPSRTMASVGGVPLAGGAAPQLQQIASDLSTGVSADGGTGAVDFRTLEPTKTWQGQLSTAYGSYDKSSLRLSLSGSVRKLGVAVQHGENGADDQLTGLTFTDTSGLTYRHDGAFRRLGDLAKLRYSASPRLTVNAFFLTGTFSSSLVCHDFVTNVPCGYGPGNSTSGNAHAENVQALAQIGNVSVAAGVFANRYRSVIDDAHLIVGSVPEPYVATTNGSVPGVFENATIAVRRHTFSFSSQSMSGNATTFSSGAFQSPATAPYRFAFASLGDVYKFSDRWSTRMNAGVSASQANSSFASFVAVTLQPSRFETLTLQGSTGTGGFGFNYGQGPFGDPARGTYNCGSDAVRVTGPNDAPMPTSTTDLELTYDRRARHGTFKANLFDRVERGSAIQAQFPIETLGVAVPPGYLAAIEQIWSRPAICAGTRFDPGRVFVAEAVTGPTVRYRGVNLSGQIALSRSVIALPSYSVNEAVLATHDPRLVAAGSAYAVGTQLPFRPLHSGGVLIDYQSLRGGVEYLVDGRWTSANNTYALTSYVVVSAGISWPTQRGRLTALATNLFNADTGLFGTREFAQPLALQGGGTYVPVPTLLPPRAYSLLYSVRWGRQR